MTGSENQSGEPERVLIPDTRHGEQLAGFTGITSLDLSKVDVDALHGVVLGEIDRRKSDHVQPR